MASWTGGQLSVSVKETAHEIEPSERRGGYDVRLCAELDELLGGPRRVVGERDVEHVLSPPIGNHRLRCSEIKRRATLAQQVDEWTRGIRFARHPAGDDQPHRRAPAAAEGERVRVGATIEQQTRDVDDVRRYRLSAARIPCEMMEQRRASEVVERRLEIGACAYELRMGVEQRTQLVDVTGNDGGNGFCKVRMRLEGRDALEGFDVVLQRRPACEAILARDDELRIGQRDWRREDLLRRSILELGVVGDNPRAGGELLLAVKLVQLVGLPLQLREIRTRREVASRHERSFREEPDVRFAGRKKRERVVTTLKVGLGPFPRTGGARRARVASCGRSGRMSTNYSNRLWRFRRRDLEEEGRRKTGRDSSIARSASSAVCLPMPH